MERIYRICLVAAFCTISLVAIKAQFIPRDPFGDPYAAGWNYAVNSGQVFDLAGDWRDDVSYVSIGTTPTLYCAALASG